MMRFNALMALGLVGLVGLVACGDKDDSDDDGDGDGVDDPSDATSGWGSGDGSDGSDGGDGGDGGGGRVGVCGARDLGRRLGEAVAEGSTLGEEDHYDHCDGSFQADGQGNTPGAVFVWEPPSTGYFRIDTVGSDFDTYLTVIEGECDGVAFACADDNGGDSTSALEIEVASVAPITIVVDAYSSQGGDFVLNIYQYD